MDVDLTIRYSDDRLCEVVVCRPNDETPLYRIATRRAHLGASITDAMREARRFYEVTPWPDRWRRSDAWETRPDFTGCLRNQDICITAMPLKSLSFFDENF